MYDSEKINSKQVLTLDWILTKVTEYDIYSKYLGAFKIGAIYNSPFRKDKNPSFGIFISRKTGKLLFKDHGINESGDVIKFVSLLTGITEYPNILNRIVQDLTITSKTILSTKVKTYIPTSTIIGVVRQAFTDTDKTYWRKFGITLKTLKFFNVDSIKYYLCNGIVKSTYKENNPMYAYKVNDNFKIYKPLADKYTKWRNNLSDNDVQGYEQLPEKGDLLIITKSLKDVMTLYEMGYYAISPSSESTWIPDKLFKAILRRFKRVLICFDRDIPGVRNMRSMSLKTGLNGFLVHKKFKAKDISDAVSIHGQKIIKEWLNKTLKCGS